MITALRAHAGHLVYVLLHKAAVYRFGRQLGLPRWQLLVHDLSKFSRAEWPAYTRWFSGPQIPQTDDHMAFQLAWAHHWQHNPHHHEFWAHHMVRLSQRDAWLRVEPRAMPDIFVREMVADWHAAYLAKRWCYLWGIMNVQHPGIPSREFYARYGARLRLHPSTRAAVEQYLGVESDDICGLPDHRQSVRS